MINTWVDKITDLVVRNGKRIKALEQENRELKHRVERLEQKDARIAVDGREPWQDRI